MLCSILDGRLPEKVFYECEGACVGVLDKGDHLDGAAALLTGFDIDLEQASSPKADVEILGLGGPGWVVNRQ